MKKAPTLQVKEWLALLAAFGFLIGLFFGTLYESAWIIFFASTFLGAVLAAAWFFGRRDSYLFPAVLFLFLALGLVRAHTMDSGIRPELEHQLESKTAFSGTIVAPPDVRETTQRLVVYANEYRTRVLVVVSRYPLHSYGETVTVEGKLEHPKPFDTDGGRTFAYDAFLAKDGIGYLVNYGAVNKTGDDTRIRTILLRPLYSIRARFDEGLQAALTEPSASLASGILLGGKTGLGKELLDAFTKTGLLPVIVLSGYNIMIVAASLLAVLKPLRQRTRFTIAAVVIIAFVIATGAGTSGVRALLMALLALFAQATGRKYAALRALIFVGVLMVLWNPLMLVWDPGFQFSWIATLGLILCSTPLQLRLAWIKNPTLREIVASTIAAQLFVLPLLLYQTGNLSLVAVVANILVLPVVPFAMLLSFIAGLVGIVLPTLALYVGIPAWVFLSYIIEIAEVFSRLPFAQVIIPAFSAWLLLPAYGLVALLTRKIISLPQNASRQPSS